jgi:hypothetical protein
MPAPTASPPTLAMAGFDTSCKASAAALIGCIALRGWGPPAAMSSLSWAPAQKAPPAPVMTRTRSVSVCVTS